MRRLLYLLVLFALFLSLVNIILCFSFKQKKNPQLNCIKWKYLVVPDFEKIARACKMFYANITAIFHRRSVPILASLLCLLCWRSLKLLFLVSLYPREMYTIEKDVEPDRRLSRVLLHNSPKVIRFQLIKLKSEATIYALKVKIIV